jgi:hypothetical protein
MLLRFRFSNFRSFRDEQELSFIAASALKETSESFVARPAAVKEGVLPVAAIFGANASGKTNVARGLAFLVQAVAESHNRWKPDGGVPFDPFLGAAPDGQASSFELDFLLNGVRHRYGFRVEATSIVEEWLHVYPKGKRQTWFHRSEGKMSFSAKLPGANRLIESLMRKNSLYLSAAAQNNHEALLPVFHWITGRLLFFDATAHFPIWGPVAEQWTNTLFKKAAVRLLQAADIGILDMVVDKPEFEDDLKTMIDEIYLNQPTLGSRKLAVGTMAQLGQHRVRLTHRLGDRDVLFEEDNESNGTKAYLRILGPVFRALTTGAILCVDELDSSLHPLLAGRIIGIFTDAAVNATGAQLLFNTHDATLLSRAPLRRDEIWFTEKNGEGASDLYPLTDYKPRQNENLENGYLQGRYGGIPFLDAQGFLSTLGHLDAKP